MANPSKKQRIEKTMKALIKELDKPSYEYKDIEVPKPKAGEILLKMEAVAICGSGKFTILKQSKEFKQIKTFVFFFKLCGHCLVFQKQLNKINQTFLSINGMKLAKKLQICHSFLVTNVLELW